MSLKSLICAELAHRLGDLQTLLLQIDHRLVDREVEVLHVDLALEQGHGLVDLAEPGQTAGGHFDVVVGQQLVRHAGLQRGAAVRRRPAAASPLPARPCRRASSRAGGARPPPSYRPYQHRLRVDSLQRQEFRERSRQVSRVFPARSIRSVTRKSFGSLPLPTPSHCPRAVARRCLTARSTRRRASPSCRR